MIAMRWGRICTRMLSDTQILETFANHWPCGCAAAPIRVAGACARSFAGQTVDLDEREDQFVFIAHGATKLVAHASDGREQIISFQFPGETFCVPARAHHSYSLCALSDVDLYVIPYGRLLQISKDDTAMLSGLLAATRTSLTRCRRKTISLGRKSASERIAAFLLEMADRIAVESEGRAEMVLPMSRRDIADSLGLTIETVSRQFSIARRDGIIETAGRSGVRILDPSTLELRAGYLEAAA